MHQQPVLPMPQDLQVYTYRGEFQNKFCYSPVAIASLLLRNRRRDDIEGTGGCVISSLGEKWRAVNLVTKHIALYRELLAMTKFLYLWQWTPLSLGNINNKMQELRRFLARNQWRVYFHGGSRRQGIHRLMTPRSHTLTVRFLKKMFFMHCPGKAVDHCPDLREWIPDLWSIFFAHDYTWIGPCDSANGDTVNLICHVALLLAEDWSST